MINDVYFEHYQTTSVQAQEISGKGKDFESSVAGSIKNIPRLLT